jgi:hypothetical protein
MIALAPSPLRALYWTELIGAILFAVFRAVLYFIDWCRSRSSREEEEETPIDQARERLLFLADVCATHSVPEKENRLKVLRALYPDLEKPEEEVLDLPLNEVMGKLYEAAVEHANLSLIDSVIVKRDS